MPSTTFLGVPRCAAIDDLEAEVAIIGIPYGWPYPGEDRPNDQARAPFAVRRESRRLSDGLDRWDFDLGGTLLNGSDTRIVDCGDVPGDPSDIAAHHRLAEDSIRTILRRGALPIVLGGDHGISIPVLRALDEVGPLTLVHVDAHIDWRDAVDGVREGYSSPIRRASECDHVERIFQIGMRGQGSARAEEVQAAKAYGAEIVTADAVHANGMDRVLQRLPAGGAYYLTIDADGLDPSVMPAVAAPVAGGLWFHQVRRLIHGLVKRGRVIGMDIVEITPQRDLNGISSLTAGQLVLNLIGATVRAGYF